MSPALREINIEAQRIELILVDGRTYHYDPTLQLQPAGDTRAHPYDCTEKPLSLSEVRWSEVPGLAKKAQLAANLDDEDVPLIRISRARDCGPVEIEVMFTNYQGKWPGAVFNAEGQLLRQR